MTNLARRWAAVVTAGTLVALFALGARDVGRPFPGFFFAVDYRVFPVDDDVTTAGLAFGDRIVAVDGGSPLALMERVRERGKPIVYDVERRGTRFQVAIPPRPFTWGHYLERYLGYFLTSVVMLGAGALVHAQNRTATPNRNFLVYMCLWAVANVLVAAGSLGFDKRVAAPLGVLTVMLSVHGWVFFLTYPANARRQAWLDRHRVIPRLYRGGLAVGLAFSAAFVALQTVVPDVFWATPLFSVALAGLYSFAVISFPIKIAALLDTRRQAASPLVDQQTAVMLWGIGLGLGGYDLVMLAPLGHYYQLPVDPQVGAALALLYPASIAYATVRYRLFDATLVIRGSVVYTVLAGLVSFAYALAIAAANALLASHAGLAQSPWFSAAFILAVVLAFNPLRLRVQRWVDRTFFRERLDYTRVLRDLARSMTSLLDLDEIVRRVTTTITSVMHVSHVELVAEPPSAAVAAVVAAVPGAISRYQVAADPGLTDVAAPALETYRTLGAEVLVPLRFGDETRGMLVLGPKRRDAPYTAEDLALLETLADQTAVAVTNAAAHRQVVKYAEELARSLMITRHLAKFVPRKVQELIEADPEAPPLEKREATVSVLFADITGYTRLSARLDLDTLDRLVEQYFGAFLDEIVKHGGDVNETAGDGLMVIFPDSDHARAAVETALGIQRRAAELGRELAPRFEPLSMHVGINTGVTSLGATKIEGRAGTRWTYTASGLTTNIAARLAALAGEGQVVVSEATRASLGESVRCVDLGLQHLKNVESPVRAYRVELP